MNKDINGYFEYLKHMIDECEYSKLTTDIKVELDKKISFIKVTGYLNVDSFLNYIQEGDDNYNFDYQLYLLFEEVSKYVFKIITYKNWLKK